MANHKILADWRIGDVITAKRLQEISKAINDNTRAVSGPKQKTNLDDMVPSSGGSTIGNEVFTAGPGDITSTTVTLVDDNGDSVDIERIDEIVLTESTSGRTMTFTITYV